MHVPETCTYFSQKYLQNSKIKNSAKKYTTHDIAISFYDIAPFRKNLSQISTVYHMPKGLYKAVKVVA